MHTQISTFEEIGYDQQLKKETINVAIKMTTKEITAAVIEGGIMPLALAMNRFNSARAYFEGQGYTITEQDIEKMTFVAEKKME